MKAQINGVELYYEIHGRGEPVLFLHGFPLSGEMWAPLVPLLHDARRLIVPDLRGLGRSGVTAECDMATYADDAAALLDAIDVTQPVVAVGLSMGGYVAFEFFRRHRRRVRALVLADTRAEADCEEAARGREETAQKVLREGSRVVADAMIGKLFAPQAAGGLRHRWHRIMSASDPVGVAAALRAMMRRADSVSTLPQIDVPTLVVVGEHDAITTPQTARSLHAAIAGSLLEIVPNAGHMTPVEQPERFAAVLRRFLADLPASTLSPEP